MGVVQAGVVGDGGGRGGVVVGGHRGRGAEDAAAGHDVEAGLRFKDSIDIKDYRHIGFWLQIWGKFGGNFCIG